MNTDNVMFETYRGKNVLVTGHTGFKGAWLCLMLQMAGANVTGYALEPDTDPALFSIADIGKDMHSVIGDIRDLDRLKEIFKGCRPEYVFHLAAQPIVREGYKNPVDTYSTNAMGTVNLLECVRHCDQVKSVINVTTDKVYLNVEQDRGYSEEDRLDGYDPYSNSKSCSELITHCYQNSYLRDLGIKISTARAGNVIGGGDFGKDRIIPDCVRAALAGETIVVRNPESIRPFQHVLEPLYVYLMIAAAQTQNALLQGAYNVGPDEEDCWTTGRLAECFCAKWGENMSWVSRNQGGPHESARLALNCSRLKSAFGWEPKWNMDTTMDRIVEWTKAYRDGMDVKQCMENQILEYLNTGREEGKQ